MTDQTPPPYPGEPSRPPVPGGEPPFWVTPQVSGPAGEQAPPPPPGAPLPPQQGAPLPAQPSGTQFPPPGASGWGGQATPPPGLVPPPPGVDYPGKTLGVVGLIVAIFANVIGIVISAIALDQSKRAGFRNTPAKAGVIVGSALLGVGLLVGLVFAVIGIVIALTAALTVPLSGPTSAPAPSAGPSEPAVPGETFGGEPLEYSVGDCFMEPTADYGHVQFVDCAEPHDYEVYSDFEVPDTADGTYPGVDRMSIAADDGCHDAYAEFVGTEWEASDFDYAFVAPDDYTWTDYGDRLVTCAIFDPEGPTTGTLEGANH